MATRLASFQVSIRCGVCDEQHLVRGVAEFSSPLSENRSAQPSLTPLLYTTLIPCPSRGGTSAEVSLEGLEGFEGESVKRAVIEWVEVTSSTGET